MEAACSRALTIDPRARTQEVGTFWRGLDDALARTLSLRRHVDAPPSSPRSELRPNPLPREDPPSDAPPPFAIAGDSDDAHDPAVVPPAAFPRAAPPPAAWAAPGSPLTARAWLVPAPEPIAPAASALVPPLPIA